MFLSLSLSLISKKSIKTHIKKGGGKESVLPPTQKIFKNHNNKEEKCFKEMLKGALKGTKVLVNSLAGPHRTGTVASAPQTPE